MTVAELIKELESFDQGLHINIVAAPNEEFLFGGVEEICGKVIILADEFPVFGENGFSEDEE